MALLPVLVRRPSFICGVRLDTPMYPATTILWTYPVMSISSVRALSAGLWKMALLPAPAQQLFRLITPVRERKSLHSCIAVLQSKRKPSVIVKITEGIFFIYVVIICLFCFLVLSVSLAIRQTPAVLPHSRKMSVYRATNSGQGLPIHSGVCWIAVQGLSSSAPPFRWSLARRSLYLIVANFPVQKL